MPSKSPKLEVIAPAKSDISRDAEKLLHAYMKFLAATSKLYSSTLLNERPPDLPDSPGWIMAAIFDESNPASPLAYTASQTALILMDFQGVIIEQIGSAAKAAVGKGAAMREWALSHQILTLHSVVDVHGRPPSTCKGAERINKMLNGVGKDRDAAEEPNEIAFSKAVGEYVVLKHPGFSSALKSSGAMDLLSEHGIKSLILCGISTSGAVLRTAMPATDEGFVVSVIQDACADPVEGLHDTLVKSVLPSRANITTAAQFMEEWAEEDES